MMYKFQKFQVCNKQSSIIFCKWTSIFLYIFLTLDIRYATAEVKYACKMFLSVANLRTGTHVFNETERRIFVESITDLFTDVYFSMDVPGFIKVDEVWHEDGSDWVTYYTLHFTSGPIEPPWILRGRRDWVHASLTRRLRERGSRFYAIANYIEPYLEGGTPRFIPRTTTYRGQIITTRPFFTPKEDSTTADPNTFTTTFSTTTPCQTTAPPCVHNAKVVGNKDEESGGGNPGVAAGAIISVTLILLFGLYIYTQKEKKTTQPVDRESALSHSVKSDEFNPANYNNQFDH